MPLKYALYPGCAAKGATPELYQSTMAIIGRLGIQVVELDAAACCGAGVVGEADPDAALAINARTFAQAERLGLDIMTICGTCQGVMGSANKRLKTEPGLLERVNHVLNRDGLSYSGKVQVKHLLWIVVREVGLHRLRQEVHVSMDDFALPPSTAAIFCGPPGISGLTTRKTRRRSRKSFEPWAASRSPMPAEPSVAASRSFSNKKPSRWRWQAAT